MSDKFKFAFRVAVSLTLAYMIPMALGWTQPSTAATTVMLIASTGSRRESLAKGTLRVLGTIAGGIIGLILVGFFAQDRLLYMFAVSLVIVVVFYIRSAYLNDPTLFMLTGVMILMMYNGGDPEGAFLYGLDRTFMTVFGVVVYTLVGVFLFPPKVEQNLRQLGDNLASAQRALFEAMSQPPEEIPEAQQQELDSDKPEEQAPHESNLGERGEAEEEEETPPSLAELSKALFAAQQAFETRYQALNSECSEISAYKKEWDGTVALFSQITELLLFAAKDHSRSGGHPVDYLRNFNELRSEVIELFDRLPDAWEKQDAHAPKILDDVEYNGEKLKQEGHLYRGEALSSGYLFNQLRERLTKLESCISSIDSLTGNVGFDLPPLKAKPNFNWWDAENAKSAVKVFVTYWVAGAFWIQFNPPGGYNFVIFSTLFVSILSFLPFHPVMLFILFTLGFVFSVPAYVFLLPQLTLGAELAVFIFTYTFVGFYVLKGPITIFFLLGMFTLGIDNNMVYHFGITLTIVTLFYMTVLSVVISYYLPFSSRPEHLLLVFRERFFRHATGVIRLLQVDKLSLWQKLQLVWRITTMVVALKKMQVWGSKFKTDPYPSVTAEQLASYIDQCDLFHHHLMTFIKARKKLDDNPLLVEAKQGNRDTVVPALSQALWQLDSSGVEALNSEHLKQDYQALEAKLDQYFSHLELEKYSNSDIAGFYIFLNLKKNIFESLLQCKQVSDEVAWGELQMKRF
ncbi:FUSC family protein [Photobacterium rosenbergii]|uniref:FUSC family protein n=1 Tax=Photobacterium rosenbergii TaxID=294936 RepID=UPI001C98E968|nr:FUSC family protein [Photobacterium rosenbergii]MBY5945862.1 FUSC family protein [Photobacterium rosenbergii]